MMRCKYQLGERYGPSIIFMVENPTSARALIWGAIIISNNTTQILFHKKPPMYYSPLQNLPKRKRCVATIPKVSIIGRKEAVAKVTKTDLSPLEDQQFTFHSKPKKHIGVIICCQAFCALRECVTSMSYAAQGPKDFYLFGETSHLYSRQYEEEYLLLDR